MSMGGFETTKINLSGKVLGMVLAARKHREGDLQANKKHASDQEKGAKAAQKGIYSDVETVDENPTSVAQSDTRSRQWDPFKRSSASAKRPLRPRHAFPSSQETPVGQHEAPQMSRHAAGKPPVNPAERLGRHASGPPPMNEPTRPDRPGRHSYP